MFSRDALSNFDYLRQSETNLIAILSQQLALPKYLLHLVFLVDDLTALLTSYCSPEFQDNLFLQLNQTTGK